MKTKSSPSLPSIFRILVLLSLLTLLSGCRTRSVTSTSKKTAKQVGVTDNQRPAWRLEIDEIESGKTYNWPESMIALPNGDLLVSQILSLDGTGWAYDNNGYITLLNSDGNVINKRWAVSMPGAELHAPKGMKLVDDRLYVCDNNRIVRYTLEADGPSTAIEIPIPGAEHLNDMAEADGVLYVSDTTRALVYAINLDTLDIIRIEAPTKVNGVTVFDGRLFAVSIDDGDVYELDINGRRPPRSFGLSQYFNGLNGIEILDDGTLIVSDVRGGAIYAISPDLKNVFELAKLDWPADIGVDRVNNRLLVPQLKSNQISIYKLIKLVYQPKKKRGFFGL